MEGEGLSVSMPLLRSGPCSKNFYEADESSNCLAETPKHTSHNLFGRLYNLSSDSSRSRDGSGYSDFHTSAFRIFNKFPKIDFESNPCNSVSRSGGRLNEFKTESTTGKGRQNNFPVQESIICAKRELMKLIGRLSSTAIAVLPAPLQYRAMQRQQIQELSFSRNYDSLIILTKEVKNELKWWCLNLQLSNGRLLVSPPPQLILSSDASLQGWGAYCNGQRTGGLWSAREKELHINVLELKAAKLAILSFHRLFSKALSIHIRMDNIVALTYLIKMGSTRSETLTTISKEI